MIRLLGIRSHLEVPHEFHHGHHLSRTFPKHTSQDSRVHRAGHTVLRKVWFLCTGNIPEIHFKVDKNGQTTELFTSRVWGAMQNRWGIEA